MGKYRKNNEHRQQTIFVRWCRADRTQQEYPGVRNIFSIPNGAHLRTARNWSRLRREGATVGVSDLFLPIPQTGYHGLFVEMKEAGNKPTSEQAAFLTNMRKAGYAATVCYGAIAAGVAIDEYYSRDDILPVYQSTVQLVPSLVWM